MFTGPGAAVPNTPAKKTCQGQRNPALSANDRRPGVEHDLTRQERVVGAVGVGGQRQRYDPAQAGTPGRTTAGDGRPTRRPLPNPLRAGQAEPLRLTDPVGPISGHGEAARPPGHQPRVWDAEQHLPRRDQALAGSRGGRRGSTARSARGPVGRHDLTVRTARRLVEESQPRNAGPS